MTKHSTAVVVMRGQLFHLGHRDVINTAASLAGRVIVILGSCNARPTPKNPFSFNERSMMIQRSLAPEVLEKVVIFPMEDWPYDNERWIKGVKERVALLEKGKSIVLVGHARDASSHYLKFFPGWHFHETGVFHNDINATKLREAYFRSGLVPDIGLVPVEVCGFLYEFMRTEKYKTLAEEAAKRDAMLQSWDSPSFRSYGLTCVTVDALVTDFFNNKVLIITRKHAPGKGAWALPGGYVNTNETIINAAHRELMEETGLEANKVKLIATRIFDHPDRSIVGRNITILHHFDNLHTSMPLKPGDDADSARMVTLDEIYSNSHLFHDDHFHMIHSTIGERHGR